MDSDKIDVVKQYLSLFDRGMEVDRSIHANLQFLIAWLNNEFSSDVNHLRLKLELCLSGGKHWRGDCEELKCG
jgi:hypothetical protein